MGKIILWFVLVVICVHLQVDVGHAKSSKLVNKHENKVERELKRDSNEKNHGIFQLKNNTNEKKNKRRLGNATENAHSGKQISSNIIHEGKITTEDYLKTLTHPMQVSKNIGTTEKQSDSTVEENIIEKSKIGKIDKKKGENASVQKEDGISAGRKDVEEQKNEQKKSKIESPKEINSKARANKDKVSLSKVERTSNSLKYNTKGYQNNEKTDLQHSGEQKIKTNLTGSKAAGPLGHAKHAPYSEARSQTNVSVHLSHSTSNSKRLNVEQTNIVKAENITKATGKTQKKAKKLLVTFFHNESDDDDEHGKKTHVANENKLGKVSSRVDLPKNNTQHAKGAHEKTEHDLIKNEHGEQIKEAKSANNKTSDNDVAYEKKAHVEKENENENGETNTKDDSPSSHTKDEESTLAEISDKLYKRTGLQQQPQVTNLNNKVIEMVLPSGPHAAAPQHVRLSSEPTHVVFKPVHKYYPAIHRYMTKPIHRYLKKPVDLSGITTPLERGQGFTTSPQVKEYTNPPLIQHNTGIPKFVAAGLGEVKQYTSSPTRVIQPSVGQKVPEGLVNDQTPALQVKNYDGGPSLRIVPGGSVHSQNAVPRVAAHVGPVRIVSQLPPRIQPVLIHPHRLSPSGFGPCSTNPCKNRGICSTVNDQAMCVCRPGFRGKLCELINRCHPNPCRNYGTCSEVERDFECSCKKGFRGKRCEIENKCEPNPCLNGATCSESEDDYVCTCREGFLGHSCEIESKCGPINPCKNGATCREAHDTYKCFCRDGFGGYNCEAHIRRNICLPNPCQNGGFCTISGTSTGNYTCSCPAGWKGATCVEKVDTFGNNFGPTICQSVNPCMFGGKCTPVSYYDYTCTCPQGRGGTHCEQAIHHPGKLVSSCSHCHAFARCLDGHCSCKEGYLGDGKNCEPVQQFCHPNPCYNGGTCRQSTKQKRSLSGGKPWWCECPTGYMGPHCQDMDLCLMRLCQNGGTCLSLKGQTKCLCPPTYSGKYCQEKDVCHGNPCKNGGSCKDIEGVASCSCPESFEGAFCQHLKCPKCDPHASCVKGNCVCNSPYVEDGLTCRMRIESPPKVTLGPPKVVPSPPPPAPSPVHKFCDSNPCGNGATCLEALGTYFCQCPENKFGKNCNQTPKVITDLCSKCDIDATCKDGRCVCNEGFNGNGFTCKKSSSTVTDISTVSTPQKTDSSCDYCPENGQCLDNICVCPPGFENRKRSCVAIDVPRMNNAVLAKTMPPGVEYVGTTRNRLPVGQWKENSVVTEYQSLGCWADTKEWRKSIMRAIHSMEGLHPSLNDDYKKRNNPITKCAAAAKAYGYKVFAVQNGGQCFADPFAEKTYTTYGPSTQCRFGVGGALANDVYRLP